jgi:DNA-binding SARP family transcriptional activator/DNA-binding CsgD family transcriptional regulator
MARRRRQPGLGRGTCIRLERVSVRIHLCGSLAVEWDGERLESALPGRQGRLLFAYLALNRERPVRRDELVDALWSREGPPAGGDSLLAPPLSRLRKALGPGRLEGRGELVLKLPGDAWIDWEAARDGVERGRSALDAGDWDGAWEAARDALQIAERGLLPGLEAPWIDERRRELDEIRVEALETMASAGARLGGARLPQAQQAARSAVEAAPFRESARVALIEVLRARGNVAEALRAYEDARTLLRDELGATPGPALVGLHEQLLRAEAAEPPARPAPGPATAAPAVVVAGDPPPEDPSSLVEREREIAMLDAVLLEAGAGHGRVALIEGTAGIGKSRLLAEARRRAMTGDALTLSARGSQLEGEFPFGAVRQLFEAVASAPEHSERAFAGAAAPARAVFGAFDEGAGANGAAGASFAALHGLYWLTLNLAAERPLLLAIDDLQWCDVPSMRFVAYLARRLEGVPVLLVATLRTGEPVPDEALLAEISSDPSTVSIRPALLSERAVNELVRARLGDDAEPEFCAACHATTGGNPLLLRQLLTALEADGVRPEAANSAVVRDIGPRAVSRSVLLRLARMSAEAAEVARAVAVLGESAELPAIAALAGLDERQVAEATGALARGEILRPEQPLGFVHPLVRDAVYHELPPGERELQHARAANVLRAAGAPAEQVASHLLVIPRRGEQWVVDVLDEASRSAIRKGATESAVAHLRRALEEPPAPERRARLLWELGVAEELVSGPAAAEHLRQAYELLEDPRERATAAQALLRTLIFTAPPEQAAALARDAIAMVPPELEDERQGLEALELMTAFFGAPEPDDLERHLADPGRLLGATGPGAKMLAAMTAFVWMLTGRGSADECAELALDALAGETLVAADRGLLTVAAIGTLVMADREEAMTIWEQHMADAHRRGSLFGVSTVHLWRGWTFLVRGELAEAQESLETALHELEVWGHLKAGESYAAAFMGAVALEQGDLARARQMLDTTSYPADFTDGNRLWIRSWTELMLVDGDAEAALAAAEDFERRRLSFIESPAWAPWRSLKAQALDRLDRREEAIALLEEELELARRWGAPGTLGRTLRILGTLKRHDGIEELEEAVALLERSTARLELARTLAALGSALRRARRPTEAREPLRRALELADLCGARALAEEARAELYAAGARPRTEALSGVEALTASERRVVDLAAAGESNRDIAQALFVTPKTVEVHLSNSYRKLGIRSRRELPAALAEA